MRKRIKNWIVAAHDIGGKTKTALFGANSKGQFWPQGGSKFKMEKVETPHDVLAEDFTLLLYRALEKNGQWHEEADLRGISICGPVSSRVCFRLVNRGILKPFTANIGDVVLNDAMAALIGSLVCGSAKGHKGAVTMLTLGTGVGAAGRYWTFGKSWEEELRFEDHEAHFAIPSEYSWRRRCSCEMDNCFEALANEGALASYLIAEGVDLTKIVKPGKTTPDLGRDLEWAKTHEPYPFKGEIVQALNVWQNILAQGIANIHGDHVMGGDDRRPPAMFVLGGGLARFVDEDFLKILVLQLSQGTPQNGANIIIRCEEKLGNRAGCIGAAASAVAKKCGIPIDEVEYLTKSPAK